MAPNDSSSQHVVTAVIVAHDGAAWLTHLTEALSQQTKPVARIVAVDTGSRDRSGSVLAAELGQGAVFGMDRRTGYAAAVHRAVQHRAATAPVAAAAAGHRTGGSGRGGEQVEWLWLLHDDCEPAADALEQLLRGAAETPKAVVLGPKLMGWTRRNVITEAGLTLDGAGRRITGVEPDEVDQGQHDGDRDVLAVSSAGMLIRRDIWEMLGGFDPAMALFGEDIDFCWRVHSAGYRVRVITDAVVFHAAAASRGRRAISVGRRARLLTRRNGLLTLLGNLPGGPMLKSLVSNLSLSLVRTLFYLVAKRPAAALDESAAVLGILGHPLRLATARKRRARGRWGAYAQLRPDLPPGRSIRRMAEFAATVLSRAEPEDRTRHASDDPSDDDWLLTDSGILQRSLTRPGVLLMIGLIAITIAAERSVITGGTLGGGALLPAWEGASSLWSQFLQAFHPSGVGSTSTGLPYVGFVAVLATIFGGKAWLAIDVLLLGSVPLAGLTALVALRRVTKSTAVRMWGAGSYALLPVAFGAIAAGRLGSAVAFVLIPLIGLVAGRMFSEPPKLARRAAWAAGLLVTVGAAFVPLLWPLAVVAAVVAAALLFGSRPVPALLGNITIAVVTPLVLLAPWLLPLLRHPRRLLLEAGVQQPGLATPGLPAKSLLLLSPGGPGLPPYWVSAALVALGLAALATRGRRPLLVGGWCAALLGFAVAVLARSMTVTPPGGQPLIPWPGVPLAVAAAGLLLAGAAGGDRLLSLAGAARQDAAELAEAGRRGGAGRKDGARRGGSRKGSRSRRRRTAGALGMPVAIVGLIGFSAPVAAAAYWLTNGVSGPLQAATGQLVPSLVSATGGGRQLRTLVLTSSGHHVSYQLLRGASPLFSAPGITPAPAAQAALDRAVATLVAPGGGQVVDQSELLGRFDIGFVLMRKPLDAALASILNGVPGLTEVSLTSSFDLWRLTKLPSRVSVTEASGAVVGIPSGSIAASATAPSAGGILELAEPAGGWSASLDGHALTPVASPAGSWAQAFKLPPGGGTLRVGRSGLPHDLLMAALMAAFLIVAALALPGIRTAAEFGAAAGAEPGGGEGLPGTDADLDERDGVGVAGASSAAGGGRAARGRKAAGPGHGRRRPAPEEAARSGRRGRLPMPSRAGPAASPHAMADEVDAASASGGGGAGRGAGRGVRGAGAIAGAASMAADVVRGGRDRPGPEGPGGPSRSVPGDGFDGPSPARAAWPAGQPASRFMSGPHEYRAPRIPEQPPSRDRYEHDDGGRGSGRPGAPAASPSGQPHSPSGSFPPMNPYDDRRRAEPLSDAPYEDRSGRGDSGRNQGGGPRQPQQDDYSRRASGWETGAPDGAWPDPAGAARPRYSSGGLRALPPADADSPEWSGRDRDDQQDWSDQPDRRHGGERHARGRRGRRGRGGESR
ncbi:MAG TPA: glycosyltransferase [Streptosporangiaceae bacterium]